jgi:hypothetical protein
MRAELGVDRFESDPARRQKRQLMRTENDLGEVVYEWGPWFPEWSERRRLIPLSSGVVVDDGTNVGTKVYPSIFEDGAEAREECEMDNERRVGSESQEPTVELFMVAAAEVEFDEDGEGCGIEIDNDAWPKLVFASTAAAARENLLVELAKEHECTAEEVRERFRLFVRRF